MSRAILEKTETNEDNKALYHNITPAIDGNGYLIWEKITNGTFVVMPDDGTIWVIINSFSENIDGIKYNYFTLLNKNNVQKIAVSYNFRVLVVFKYTDTAYKIGLITGYNNKLWHITSLDDYDKIFEKVINIAESKKTGIIRVIKSNEYNNDVMNVALSQLQTKLPAISNKKSLINLRKAIDNNIFELSDISSYADYATKYNLQSNFGLPSYFVHPNVTFGSQSAAFSTHSAPAPQSAAFSTHSAPAPQSAFGFESAVMVVTSDKSLNMANYILNIYLELSKNYYNKYIDLNEKNTISELKKSRTNLTHSDKILTRDDYDKANFVNLREKKLAPNISDSLNTDLINILFKLFGTNDVNKAKKQIELIEDTLKPKYERETMRNVIIFKSIKNIYGIGNNEYTSDEFFNGIQMLDKLLFLLNNFAIISKSRAPPLRFGVSGGDSQVYKNIGNKEVLGKNRIIFKTAGSNKEYVKNKGIFIPVSEYKKQQRQQKA